MSKCKVVRLHWCIFLYNFTMQVVEVSQRLLQGLLKDCHRKGYKNALTYRDMFQLSGPKFLSSDDKQQIILLLVQNFEVLSFPYLYLLSMASPSVVLTCFTIYGHKQRTQLKKKKKWKSIIPIGRTKHIYMYMMNVHEQMQSVERNRII